MTNDDYDDYDDSNAYVGGEVPEVPAVEDPLDSADEGVGPYVDDPTIAEEDKD